MASRQGSAEPQERVKILAVDDDADNLLALQAILEPLGQVLLLAKSGFEALKLCLENDFAAILLDVRMPELDGFETAQMIRQRRRSSRTPILFLTAYRSDEQLFRGYDIGAVDFLFKPIVPEVLQSKVTVFVELSRSEQILRRQANELSRTEEKFRTLLEAAPDAMVITSAGGVIELANSRADELFGRSRESLLGTSIKALIPEWCWPPQADNTMDGGQSQVRLTAVRDDGVSFPVDVTISPFTTADGVLFTTAVRDATDQVLAEARIQRINLELERRVQERTAELTRSNEALRQFAWAASHDLQEPIRTVMAYTDWLAESSDGKLDNRERQMLEIIAEHSHRLHRLFEALRQYIRVAESGQQNWTLVDCRVACEIAVRNLQTLIESSSAIISCEPLPKIYSIEVLLVQLFQNLIANGIKYRSAAPPSIQIWAVTEETGCTLCIKDNGIGIDPEHFEYIFGVFKRLQAGAESGTGIGLALCKTAVERLGGRIWVESSVGHGSTFFCFLPQGVPDEHAPLADPAC